MALPSLRRGAAALVLASVVCASPASEAAAAEGGESSEATTAGTAERGLEPWARRQQCPNYHHMSCLLDVLSRICDENGDQPHDVVDPRSNENVWLCCCKVPYKKCDFEEAVQGCNAALMTHVGPLVKKGAAVTKDETIAAIQRARGKLRQKGGEPCAVLAEEAPQTGCGSVASPPVPRPFERIDLVCELLTWQWDLGDADLQDFQNNGCPFDAEMESTNPRRSAPATLGHQHHKPHVEHHSEEQQPPKHHGEEL